MQQKLIHLPPSLPFCEVTFDVKVASVEVSDADKLSALSVTARQLYLLDCLHQMHFLQTLLAQDARYGHHNLVLHVLRIAFLQQQ
eukprot:UN14453